MLALPIFISLCTPYVQRASDIRRIPGRIVPQRPRRQRRSQHVPDHYVRHYAGHHYSGSLRPLRRGMESAPRGAPHLGPGHPPHQNHGGLALHLRCLEASDFGVLHPLRGVLDRERGWVGVPVVPGGLGAVAVRSVQVIHQRVLVGSYDRRFPAGVRGE